jgi:hypothetical protein
MGVTGLRETVRELEEAFPLLLSGLEAGLDEVGNDAAGTRLARSGERLHPAREARRQTDTLPDWLFSDRHGVRIQHCAPQCTSERLGDLLVCHPPASLPGK